LAAGVEPDAGSFPPVSEFGLRGVDTDLSVIEDGDDARALERHRALMSPAAKERRARFAKYVVGAVGFSLVLCAAAVVKTALPAPSVEPVARVALAAAPATPSVDVSPSTPEGTARPEAPPTASASAASKGPTAGVDPQAVPSALVMPAQDPTPLTAPLPGAGAAKQRESSRFALERGDLSTAVAAGERSVALDPTDGEAWLILGAAYQAGGELVQAKRCYRACVAQARRGPKAECQAMSQTE
jgi:tetratricopeptide (TPR) repeat protein